MERYKENEKAYISYNGSKEWECDLLLITNCFGGQDHDNNDFCVFHLIQYNVSHINKNEGVLMQNSAMKHHIVRS